jgi:REP element-mobilizing transposase RayT/CheY-like chemotaxis protein
MAKNEEIFLVNQEIKARKPSILVATPFSELGEIISESLKEVANIIHIQKVSQAITTIKKHPDYRQAILDMEFGDLNLLNLGKALRSINPAIELLIISKDEPPTDLDEIQPWKFLRKPLLLPDLEAALGISVVRPDLSGGIVDVDTLDNDYSRQIRWSNNPSLATRYLKRLVEKSFAQEALLIQNQELWSFAGRLSEESVYELNSSINKSILKESTCDFTKFVRLETTQTEHALYASMLFVGVILALVFDPDIPLGVIRKQTKELANTLLILDGNDVPEKSLSGSPLEAAFKLEQRNIPNKRFFLPPSDLKEDQLNFYDSSASFSMDDAIDFFPEAITSSEKIEDTQKMDPVEDFSNSNPGWVPAFSEIEPGPAVNESDGSQKTSEANQLASLHESDSDELYNLTYSCLLIPRFASNPSTNEREKEIAECIKHLHTSHGWRLESIKVQPDYLLWASNFPPTITPSKHIDAIRKETSKLLYEGFPTHKRENPSGDYWAPGYLIVGGKNAISDQLVSAYSKHNRMKHGVGMAVSSAGGL